MENGVIKDDDLSLAQQQFLESYDASIDMRAEGEQARDYYDGKQWTAAEIDTLRKRKQPVITDNRIKDKVEYLLGLERRTRTDPKAYPRNPNDEESAEAATDALRYLEETSQFDQIRSDCFENMLIEGYGACEVIYDSDVQEIKVKRIRWDRLYFDPRSQERDFRDATYIGIVTWMDENRAKSRWPEKAEMFSGMFSEATKTSGGDTYDDKPRMWIDGKRRRVQIMEHYWWSGQWKRGVYCQGGWLEEPTDSPYKDEYGRPECPIILQAAYRDRDGDCYGIVRRYKDLQDEINKRRSKSLHLLSSRQIVAEKGAVDDIAKARVEVSRPDGYVEVTPGMRFELAPTSDLAAGQFNLLADAINALAATGPNAALQGNSGSLSGRAKQLDQEGGAIQIGALFDQLRYFQYRVYRSMWNRIRQFWTDETWIRVRDDEGAMKFVGLNTPITAGEQAVEQIRGQVPPEELMAMVQNIAADPMAQIPVAKKNAVAEMDVDIIIEEAPDTITIQQEQFQQLVNLASAGVVMPPEVYIEASSLRNKRALIDKLKGAEDPQMAQAQQEAQALAKAGAEAEVMAKQAKAAKDDADAQKTRVEMALAVDNATAPI